MAYRKIVLQTLRNWDAVNCFPVGPRGNVAGAVHQGNDRFTFEGHDVDRYFVVSWALDGSIIWSAGPFEAVVASGAMNAAGEVMATVRPLGAKSLRPVLIRGGKVCPRSQSPTNRNPVRTGLT